MAWKLGALRGLGARWRTLTVFAAVEMAVPWPLLGFGEIHVSSSLAAILVATVPLFVRSWRRASTTPSAPRRRDSSGC